MPMPTAGPPTAATIGFFISGSASKKRARRRFLARGGALEEIGEIVAGAEAVLRAVQQHRAHLLVGIGGGERVARAAVHLGGDRVLLVGARELDARDAIRGFSPYQACSPSSAAAA